jgi:hypothetical protein
MRVTKARVGATLVAGAVAIGVAASPAAAMAKIRLPAVTAVSYRFRTLDNANDPNFNQLRGINNRARIVGFYGSGAHGSPNKGYVLSSPYGQGSYHAENFPGSAQTEVAGINDNGVTVGLFSKTNRPSLVNAFAGFYRQNGTYHKVTFPTSNNSSPAFNELLGINNAGIAVGDYTDSLGLMQAYRLNINTHKFAAINIRNSSNETATGINVAGSVVGYFTNAAGEVVGFVRHSNGVVVTFAVRGAVMTQAFGINKTGLVVGAYTIGGSTYGFTWAQGRGFRTVNDPHGVGSTLIRGVNNAGDLVGYYTDSQGNTNGFLATP